MNKSEAKYQMLLEKSLAGIFRVTVEGNILECNNSFARILGYDSVDGIKKISTITLYANPADRDIMMSILDEHGELKYFQN